MSGRGFKGRGSGRGGRGYQGKGRFYNKGKPTDKKKKTLADYIYYVVSSSQASDYKATTEFLINHIREKSEYSDDIGDTLEKESKLDTDKWKPTLKRSSKTDEDEKEGENDQLKMEFEIEYAEYRERMKIYKNNLSNAYSTLWEHCSKTMQTRIKATAAFESTIKGNPIELVKSIRQHALDYQEDRYAMRIIADALINFVTTRQREEERLEDYTIRFKTARDLLKDHIGCPIVLRKYMEKMPGYDAKDKGVVKKFEKEAFEEFTAYFYLNNADQKRYGTVLKGLHAQQNLNNDQYPKKVADANQVLNEHPVDNASEWKKRQQQSRYDKLKHRQQKTQQEEEETQEDLKLSFLNMEDICYCCGSKKHYSNDCPDKNKPKEKWYFNKTKNKSGKSFFQVDGSDKSSVSGDAETTASTSTIKSSEANSQPRSDKLMGWTGVHMARAETSQIPMNLFNEKSIRSWILIDNQSSVTIFCNKDMVKNIRKSSDIIEITTNGGPLICNTKCTVPGFGDAWFNEKSVTNILSYAEVVDKFTVTYDSKNEDAFCVTTHDKSIKLKRSHNKLYFYQPERNANGEKYCFIETVEEKKLFYSERQVARAKAAREFYHAVGSPSMNDIRAIIRMNLIKNNPITIKDIELMKKIFGPNVGTIKGKTTRRRPTPVIEDLIDIPRELKMAQQKVTVAIDGMTVNSLKFLTSIALNLYYRTAQYLRNSTASDLKDVIAEIFQVYRSGGFIIVELRCDNEFQPLDLYLSKNTK